MTERSYGQYCGLAGALDLVGERWTLLIVRELMSGPKRYTDLADGMPGIGTSLLAKRLAKLENSEVIERRLLPPPAAAMVYDLAPAGHELAAALGPLITWGLRHVVPEAPGNRQFNATWCVLPFTQPADPLALAGIEATYEFRIRDTSALLRVHDGHAELLPPGTATPDTTISMDPATVAALGAGRHTISEVEADGAITVEGDFDAAAALFAAFESGARLPSGLNHRAES
ncbi:MAG TPA: winged helix-turn-helix transcriptional regulator [Solirubrobacterales bacterium]|nr:winged helix-turn-helix transcriptional regulator [Solirubrobacterales bacterium]